MSSSLSDGDGLSEKKSLFWEFRKGPSIKYLRSNLVIFRHPFPPFTLLNNTMTS